MSFTRDLMKYTIARECPIIFASNAIVLFSSGLEVT